MSRISHLSSCIKAITLLMAFLCPLTLIASEILQGDPKNILYFALEGDHSAPAKKQRTHFECSDKVYGVVELNGFPKGKHKFSMRWNDPAKDERERVDYPFTVNQDKTRLWAWLNLIRPPGAGMIQWINPAAGLEDFIGPWEVEIYINNKKILSESFSMDC